MQTIEFNYIQFTSVEQLHEFLTGIDYTLSDELECLDYVLDTSSYYAHINIGDYILRKGNCVTTISEEEFNDLQIN